MINFSIMIPTRKRAQHLRLVLDSIFNTSKDISKIEIQIGVDTDDSSWKSIVEQYKTNNIFIHSRIRGDSFVEHYANWLASFCTGKYIIMANDDCLFRTEGWDLNVFNKLEAFLKGKSDGLVCGIVKDGEEELGRGKSLGFLTSSFPLLSRNTIEVLGFLFNPQYRDASADTNMQYTYHLLDRVVDLRKICTIQHRPPEMKNLDNNYFSHKDRDSIQIQSTIKKESLLTYDKFSKDQLQKLKRYIKIGILKK